MKEKLFIIFLFISLNSAYAQNKIKVTSENAEIISEKNEINIIGQKDYDVWLKVRKTFSVKIKDSVGLNYFSNYTFPENFDPTYIAHSPDIKNENTLLDKLSIISINATIKRKNGTIENAIVKQSIKKTRSISVYDRFEDHNLNTALIENLNIGDEATITYCYTFPFHENYSKILSSRIFFHGEVFKGKYEFILTKYKNLPIDFKYFNGGEPDSILEKEDLTHYIWTKTNLPGCISEAGSRAYLSLPYFLFNIKPYSLLYTLPFSFEERFMPFYALAAYTRENSSLTILKSVHQGLKNNQMVFMKDFINKLKLDSLNDSIGIQKMMKFQSAINDEYTYASDSNYFTHEKEEMERLGDCAAGSTIKESSKYNFYYGLIALMDFSFYSGYAIDNRFGEISQDYFKPMFFSDYFIAPIMKNKSIQLLLPKSSRYGYYLTELPFYYENTKVRLIHLDDFLNTKEPIQESFQYFKSPNSSINENVRKSNIMVNVDLEKKSMQFVAKLTLMGQYSTLNRGLYKFNVKDKTINDAYNRKIYEINPTVNLNSCIVDVKETFFPFKTIVNCQYSCNNLVSSDNNNYFISLKNWFNFAIYKNINAENRVLDFYPDFVGSDSYTYIMKFNKEIELLDSLNSIQINNDFGSFMISIKQIGSTTINMVVSLTTKAEIVKKEDISLVDVIYDAASKLENDKISFKIK